MRYFEVCLLVALCGVLASLIFIWRLDDRITALENVKQEDYIMKGKSWNHMSKHRAVPVNGKYLYLKPIEETK